MAEFAERLKQGLKLRNMKQLDLADKAGVSAAMISYYISGKFTPKMENAITMAEILDVPVEWLMGRSDELQKKPNDYGLQPVSGKILPRLGAIPCGTPVTAEQTYDGADFVPVTCRADFCLVCEGNSMIDAHIFDGDLVLIRSQSTVNNGDIAAVRVGDEEATLKKVYVYGDHIILKPCNPEFEPMVFFEERMDDIHIMGKAVSVIHDFE